MNNSWPQGEIEKKIKLIFRNPCRIPGSRLQDLLNGQVLQLCNFTRDTVSNGHSARYGISVFCTICSREMKQATSLTDLPV